MLTTQFTELFGCRLPLQQAPMGGVTTPELVAAVAGAGAVGMVPALVAAVYAGGALASWQAGSVAEALATVDAGCDLVAV